MKGSVYTRCGLLLLAAGLLFGGVNLWEAYRAGASAKKILLELEPQVSAAAEASEMQEIVLIPAETEPCPSEMPDGVPPLPADAPDEEEADEMAVTQLDGEQYIGMLQIPSLGLTLPVAKELSGEKLRKTPCRYLGTAGEGSLIISAHNYPAHFGKLKELQIGDEVIFTDVKGTVYRYTVSDTELLDGDAVEEMEAGAWDLTLFTCTVGGKRRVTVRCEYAVGQTLVPE